MAILPKRKDEEPIIKKITPNYKGALEEEEETGGAPVQTASEEPSQYDYLREQSARDLLDKNVASYISNEAAKKSAAAEMAKLGLANSGYASTANAMLGNDLQASLASNRRDYEDALLQIDKEETAARDSALAEEASNFATKMQNLTGADLDQFMQSNGFTYNKETQRWEKEGYSQTMLDDINNQYFINQKASGVVEGNSFGKETNVSDALANIVAYSNNGSQYDVKNPKDLFANEMQVLLSEYKNPAEGTIVRLASSAAGGYTAVLVYSNGQWKQLSPEQAVEAAGSGKAHTIMGASPITEQERYYFENTDDATKKLIEDSLEKYGYYQVGSYRYVKDKDGNWVKYLAQG